VIRKAAIKVVTPVSRLVTESEHGLSGAPDPGLEDTPRSTTGECVTGHLSVRARRAQIAESGAAADRLWPKAAWLLED
jgi:hypothetical protein